jgi:hypothetical protein
MRDNHVTYRPSYFMLEIIDLNITYQNHNLHTTEYIERLMFYTLHIRTIIYILHVRD